MSFYSILAIAKTTFIGFARDRIFYGVIVFAILFLSFSYLVAMLTIVEQRKILLDFGFTAISLSGVFVAIFLGIVAVAKEIENRTIYSVISKPISRTEYLLGKYFGSFLVLIVVHTLLSLTLTLILKVNGEGFPSGLSACFLLMFLESAVLLALAALCSVFTSSFLAGTFSFAMFLIGRSNASLLLLSQKAHGPSSQKILHFLYWITPNLDRYNIRDIVAYGKPYPHEMLPNGLLYCFLYAAFCLCLSSLIFKKRDLP